MTLKRLTLAFCFACCLSALALPVVATYYTLPDFGLMDLGPFWLMIGNHFLLIPLIIFTLHMGQAFFLPLTTWLLMLVNLSIFIGLEGLGHGMTFHRQSVLSDHFLLLSIIAITLVYLKLDRSMRPGSRPAADRQGQEDDVPCSPIPKRSE